MKHAAPKIFGDHLEFEMEALRQFKLQYAQIDVYRQYIDLLRINTQHIDRLEKIPFLPIEFFKTHSIMAQGSVSEAVFSSSGTSGQQTSQHHVTDLALYEQSFRMGFERFYGSPNGYCILALLPSYLERGGSSLLYMAQDLIAQSGHPHSGFYLDDYKQLITIIKDLESAGQKTLLLGVSFALLDLAEALKKPISLNHTVVMETGGMKGRRKEMVRADLHQVLQKAFGLNHIHSEYGMTELLSQAYSSGEGIFHTPPWMKIVLRDSKDPLSLETSQRAGGINVIDLANINSCSFIATQDLGKLFQDGSFEVLGRFDSSDIRGCNLLVEASST